MSKIWRVKLSVEVDVPAGDEIMARMKAAAEFRENPYGYEIFVDDPQLLGEVKWLDERE